ncbi:hypothetical protein D3C80_881160 [compost metagenome]
MVFLEDVGDLFLIDVHLDGVDRLHQLGQGRGARAAQQAADGHPADRPVHRVDDIDVEEELGQVVALGAHVVDGVADVPELRRGHELALHQAAGGILGVAQRAFDGGALDLGHGGQHPLALVVLQVLDDRGGVVRIQFLQGLGQGGGGDALEHLLADAVVHLGQGFGQQVRRQPLDHDRAVLGGQEAHEIGDVSGVQVFQQAAQAHAVAVVGGVHHLFDEGRRQGVILAEGGVIVLDQGLFRAGRGGIRVGHVSASPGVDVS